MQSGTYRNRSDASAMFSSLLSWDGSLSYFTRMFLIWLMKIAVLYSYASVSTTYMGQIMAYELDREPDPELATRTGELAMLIYSIGWFRLLSLSPLLISVRSGCCCRHHSSPSCES